ncbi:MAG: CPBP family intramembrane glutamic endopeptidase [Candidatus Limnocylindrales bacterium]
MRETVEALIVLGLLGLLVILRFDAQRFGVAEYDDSARDGSWRAWVRRLAWFVLGIALVLTVYWLYPQPVSVLHLDIGGAAGGTDRGRAMFYGLLIGVAGIFVAAVYAWGRYGGIRLPAPRAYPAAFVNSVGTAIVDEATFRGILLGMLLNVGFGSWVAIGIAAVVYGIATRLTARGRSKGMLVIDLLLAVATGWTVIETGGIGAAVLGHAITRFAIFLLTGHTDQSRPFGTEPENVAGRALPPKGWDVAGRSGGTRPWTTNVVGAEGALPASLSGPTHAGESPFAGQGYLPAASVPPRAQAVPMAPQAVPMPPYMGPPPGMAPDGSWGPQEQWPDQPPGGYLPPEGMPPPPPAYDDAQGGQRG